ncbi:hypothetical protein NIES4075_09830 [Tolypothrix sp. NIES-4075]|uniref:DUF2281 domain-containing protein n=1 Tax=Tolypothrix sp. NIES-4075 TaxID=2005459 RepID=UPI000B5C432E|nr:DUF2281 domain-containing protein [Tolypothrix sp. NIES-4075]GAX40021.1 hypothetical protein NIES4075_09830 [Tolypothrix sp. NIES-4075]
MSIEQIIVEKLRTLPPQKQQEALDFVEFLQGKTSEKEFSEQEQKAGISALTIAEKWAGCLEGEPFDHSCNYAPG